MATATARDIIASSLREIGVLEAGEVGTYQEAKDGLDALNNLLDQWAAEPLSLYTLARTTFSIVSGTQEYTVGTGFATAAGFGLHRVGYIETATDPDTEIPLVKLNDDQYISIAQKAATSTAPTGWYLKEAYPSAIILLLPTPTSSTLTGVRYSWTHLTRISNLSDNVSFPPGYQRMLVKNLAVDLAPQYEKQVNPLLFQQANDSKAAVKRANYRPSVMSFDAGALIGTGSHFSILTGE